MLSFVLPPTPTYRHRQCLWMPGGPGLGFLAITTIGRDEVTVTYGVASADGAVILERLHDADPPGIPAAIAKARRRTWERGEAYAVRFDPDRCSCRSAEECKHVAAVRHMVDGKIITVHG